MLIILITRLIKVKVRASITKRKVSAKTEKVKVIQIDRVKMMTTQNKAIVKVNQSQGQGQSQGQARHSTLKCYYCSNIGHIKRNCPVLKADQNRGVPDRIYRTQRPTLEGPSPRQPQFNPNNIDLN